MIGFLATLGGLMGSVLCLVVVGICVAASGSWWPLSALLVLAIILWVLPWEIIRERRAS